MNLESTKTYWIIAALVFVNLLPYLCRLPRGWDWMTQYWPDPGHEVIGLIFFHSFYSIAAAPLVLAIRLYKGSVVPCLLTLIVVTAATCYFNYNYDLASDAQAAIGLIFMPVVVSILGFIAFALGWYLDKRLRNPGVD